MFQVTFPEIVRVLETLSATIPAAEGHGCLCGALCTTTHYPLDRWLDEIIPDLADASEGDRRVLNLLFTDTLNALRGDQMEFEPLLPDDDATLERRAAALSQWCQGFLYGFGSGRPRTSDDLPPNVEEILRDLTQIGRAAVDAGESGEEEEEAYTEVVEYVRAGVQLIHDELTEARDAESFPDMHDDSQQDGGDNPRLN
jgi:uncharacterized protein YgfB (UPF0149 family)